MNAVLQVENLKLKYITVSRNHLIQPVVQIGFKRHLSWHVYSPLNSDTYSNDQNPSVLKFRINPRPQKQANEKKKKLQKQKGSKCYSQDQSL